MIVTKEDIIRSTQKRYSDIMTAIVNEDYDELYGCICSSLYAGDEDFEWKSPKPVLSDSLQFTYKGYDFELLNMVGATNKQIQDKDYKNILSDKYALYGYAHVDADGKTEDDCDDPECWIPRLDFIEWWWGSSSDLNPGSPVAEHILMKCDEWIHLMEKGNDTKGN